MQNTTIAAIATAPGAGGIAVVRLSGPESYAVAARVFHPANPNKNVEEAKGYTALFGSFVEGDDAFDEGVALFFREPHSYTGEDVVELSCHGGSAVARRLVEACIAAGAAPAAPGEYTRRAFLNGKMSLTQAEAVMDMISADGKQGAALANASLSGALAKKIGAEKEALTGLQAHLARGGSLQISTEVIGKIARCAALEIDGVAEVSCGRQNKKLKDLLEASSIQSPVVVEMRDGTANITLNLMMSFGARIPAVAEKVQENVKNAVQNMTNVTVSRVNLVIAGLAETTAAEK